MKRNLQIAFGIVAVILGLPLIWVLGLPFLGNTLSILLPDFRL